MRRWVLGTTFVAVMGLLALPNIACEDPQGGDSQALQVVGNALVSTRTQCQNRAGSTEYRSRGYMDLALTNTYFLYPQVENLLPTSADLTGMGTGQLRAENNRITIIGALLKYGVDDTGDPETAFGFRDDYSFIFDDYQGVFMPASGTVAPGETGPLAIQAVPWELGNEMAADQALSMLGGAGAEITIRMRVVGLLADGTEVQSNEFWFPLTVCNGCLVYFPPRVDPRRLEEQLTPPCVPGQDDGVDTRICYMYATAPTTDPEDLNQARDRCRWQHILLSIEPPDSDYYWRLYGPQFFPEYKEVAEQGTVWGCGLGGVRCDVELAE